MADPELAQAVEAHNVFARLTPAHKDRIVRQLKSNGRIVGFMGDGINDAPALRAADIGISVDIGRATSPRKRPTSSCSKGA